jgi:3',5'-cyclic AMP phosphodiesterase CpdA
MTASCENRKFRLVLLAGMLILSAPGCANNGTQSQPGGYPIASVVETTAQRTIAFDNTLSALAPAELSKVSQYAGYGYGDWTFGDPLPSDPRTDIMPAGYERSGVTKDRKLLNFFTITDIHITDKESPNQVIYLQQVYYPLGLPAPFDALGSYPWAWETSVYSPVMLYTTHVLDAAVQTVNALHKENPIDFGISLGDAANSTQYNELRWYIDVLDGKVITPSSGAHAGAGTIDYQKPYKAAGLDKTIPWYQALGNHDHFTIGSIPVGAFLRQSYISDTVVAMGDILYSLANVNDPVYYMGVIDGSTPYGDIVGAGPVVTFNNPPKVVADADRRSLLRTEWIGEFFTTTSNPVGHGFTQGNIDNGFACYSFVPKSDIPIKVIVLDDTQSETDGDNSIHGHGYLDAARWDWLKKELADGDAAGQLMIIAAHIPIGVQPPGSFMEWWDQPAECGDHRGPGRGTSGPPESPHVDCGTSASEYRESVRIDGFRPSGKRILAGGDFIAPGFSAAVPDVRDLPQQRLYDFHRHDRRRSGGRTGDARREIAFVCRRDAADNKKQSESELPEFGSDDRQHHL